MASCVRNILTKNFPNLIISFQVTIENVGDAVLRRSVVLTTDRQTNPCNIVNDAV